MLGCGGEDRMSESRTNSLKGRTLEDRYGKKKANEIKKNASLKQKTLRRKIKNVYQIHNVMFDILKNEKILTKKDFFNNKNVKQKLGCSESIKKTLQKYNLTLDKVSSEFNFKFISGQTQRRKFTDLKQVEIIIKNVFKYNKPINRKEFRNNKVIKNHGERAIEATLKRNNLTLDEFVSSLNLNFKKHIHNKRIININKMKQTVKDVFKYNSDISKTEFFNNKIVKKKLGCHGVISRNLKNNKLTIDDIAKEVGVQFKKTICVCPNIGTNEKQLLDNIEQEEQITIQRQVPVLGYFLDGYDPINNIAYEIDEQHHRYQQVKDMIRERLIKEQLGCNVIRIKDGW